MEIEGNVDIMKDDLRVIPIKNYIILGIVILVSFLILYYFYMWVDAYKETKLNTPILDKYMEVINYNEINDFVMENPDTIIYVSILEDEKIRDFEKKIKVSFRRNMFEHDMLYLDITKDINNSNLLNDNNGIINLSSIRNVPCVVVIKNGVFDNIYMVSDNNYDIDNFINFINNVRFDSEMK